MAATPIGGTDGMFLLTGHNARIASWSAILTQEVNDASGFPNSGGANAAGWRENLGGMKSLSGTAAGYAVSGAASTAPAGDYSATGDKTGVAFTLTAKTGVTYTGTAIVNIVQVGTSINGNAPVMFRFESTGAVTETWATS